MSKILFVVSSATYLVLEPYTVRDRNLITGHNPHSAAPLAELLLKLLG